MSNTNLRRYNLRLQRSDLNEFNRVMTLVERRLDQLEGIGQNPSFHGGRLTNVASMAEDDSGLNWDQQRSRLSVRVSDDSGLVVDSEGVKVVSDENGGLTGSESGLAVKLLEGGGLTVDSDGLAIASLEDVDDATEVQSLTASSGADTLDLADLNTRLGTLVDEINAVVTVLNTVISRLRDANVLE